VDLLRDQRAEVLIAALPGLRSADPVKLAGAFTLVRNLGFAPPNPVEPPLLTQLETALIDAADHFAKIADEKTRHDYAELLSYIRPARGPAVLKQSPAQP
jgi:hypothetical protein